MSDETNNDTPEQLRLFAAPRKQLPPSPGELVEEETRKRRIEARQEARRLARLAEAASWPLLGAVLMRSDAIARVSDLVRPGDFPDPFLGSIFHAATVLHRRGAQVTVHAVVAELRREGVLLLDGGRNVQDLAQLCPPEADAELESYARVLRAAGGRK